MRSIVLAIFATVAMIGMAMAAPRWQIYANARFNYQICYPADLLKPQPEAVNGDGRVFVSPSGASLTVWGNYNVTNESLAELTAGLADPSATISYRRIAESWSVMSGKKDGLIFYSKILFEKGDSATIRTFKLVYPESQATTFDAIAGKLGRCFVAGSDD